MKMLQYSEMRNYTYVIRKWKYFKVGCICALYIPRYRRPEYLRKITLPRQNPYRYTTLLNMYKSIKAELFSLFHINASL